MHMCSCVCLLARYVAFRNAEYNVVRLQMKIIVLRLRFFRVWVAVAAAASCRTDSNETSIGSRFFVFAARNTRLRIADFTQTFHSNEHRKILIRCWRWHFSSDRCMLTCWIIFVSRCCCLCCCKFGCHRSCRSGPPFMLNGIFQSQSKWYRGAGARALALRLIWFRYGVENSLCMRIESDDSSIRTLDAINSANRKIYSDSKIISSNSNEKDDLLMIPNG